MATMLPTPHSHLKGTISSFSRQGAERTLYYKPQVPKPGPGEHPVLHI